MPVNIAATNCPVCQYQDVKGDTCPNCDTDISLICALKSLKIVETKEEKITELKTPPQNVFLRISFAALLGFLAGTLFSYWSLSGINTISQVTQAPLAELTEKSMEAIVPIEIDSKIPNESPVQKEPEKIYQVKNGDSLLQVAEKLCGDSAKWKKFVMSNETLVGRKDYLLNVSESLVIPSECKSL